MLGEPLRPLCGLASGYPLHQPRRAFGTSRLVPLLSLSLVAPLVRYGFAVPLAFYARTNQ